MTRLPTLPVPFPLPARYVHPPPVLRRTLPRHLARVDFGRSDLRACAEASETQWRCPTSIKLSQPPAGFIAFCAAAAIAKTVWPSGLRRWLQAPVRKGVGSSPTAVNSHVSSGRGVAPFHVTRHMVQARQRP